MRYRSVVFVAGLYNCNVPISGIDALFMKRYMYRAEIGARMHACTLTNVSGMHEIFNPKKCS